MTKKKEITSADIMDVDDYAAQRKDQRAEVMKIKKNRRVAIGPYAMAYFECFETMLYQIHEMLLTERGGEEQLKDEMAAYNPLIPQGSELVATVMFEIENKTRRDQFLRTIGGVDDTMTLAVDGEKSKAVPESDLERTTAEGKASSVHFMHFPLSDSQKENFKKEGAEVVIAIEHENYSHMAKLPEAVRAELATDLD